MGVDGGVIAIIREADPPFCTTSAFTGVFAEISLAIVASLNRGNKVAEETGTVTVVPSGCTMVTEDDDIAWTVPRSTVTVTIPFFFE